MAEAAAFRRLALPERGVEIALLDWGGSGPLALLHHANGFCKGTWGLVAEGLRDHLHVVAMDARGHGDSSHPEGPDAYAWSQFADDLVAVAEALASEQADGRIGVGVGHSFGGTTLLGAAGQRPDLFARIVLVDPVIPVPSGRGPAERGERLRGLVEGARRRRAEWPSRSCARAWFAARPLFARWDARALDLYVADGLRERPDGSVVLKCCGDVEAAVFEAGQGVDALALAGKVKLPACILWASGGDFPRALPERLAAAMQDARVEDLESGHLAPMERSQAVSAAVLRFAFAAAPQTAEEPQR